MGAQKVEVGGQFHPEKEWGRNQDFTEMMTFELNLGGWGQSNKKSTLQRQNNINREMMP